MDRQFWEGKKVLVTGHTGFKGSWLSVLLSSLGANVYGYSLPVSDANWLYKKLEGKLEGLTDYFGDICEKELIERTIAKLQPDIIFHMAAQPLVYEGYIEPQLTWESNVIGTLNVLEGAKAVKKTCGVVCITTDKVYKNREWLHSYRECDELGGKDPYSASKAATEILVESWRESFCGEEDHQTRHVLVSTARSGNVIGGGDMAENRIVTDAIKCAKAGNIMQLRMPNATRPWQHVLDPIAGYMRLAERLYNGGEIYATCFNFGPCSDNERSVLELAKEIQLHLPELIIDLHGETKFQESCRLGLSIEKAAHLLEWTPRWDFKNAVEKTICWYKDVERGGEALECCMSDIREFLNG